MAVRLLLMDAAGEVVTLEADGALDFGTLFSGETSGARQLKVRNAGDEAVYFPRVRAVPHPFAQRGPGAASYGATEFALDEEGDYRREVELATLLPDEEEAFWVRVSVPRGAPPGVVLWAVEVLASTA